MPSRTHTPEQSSSTIQSHISRPCTAASLLVGLARCEPLYDVLNEHGEILMVGVSHQSAASAIDAHQELLDVPSRWQGDICVKLQRNGRQPNWIGGAA
jgi:hypothetical protein